MKIENVKLKTYWMKACKFICKKDSYLIYSFNENLLYKYEINIETYTTYNLLYNIFDYSGLYLTSVNEKVFYENFEDLIESRKRKIKNLFDESL